MRTATLSLLGLILAVAASWIVAKPGTSRPRDAESEFALLAQRHAEQMSDGRQLAAQGVETRRDASEVVRTFTDASAELNTAASTFRSAAVTANAAAATFDSARRRFERAERRYYIATAMLIAGVVAGHVCATNQTTAQFRRTLQSQGIDVNGRHIHHAWARNACLVRAGDVPLPHGVDNPGNYVVASAALNGEMGCSVLASLRHFPLETVRGFAVTAMSILMRCAS